ncbi:MAG: hypothetical protein IPN18_10965 [Ignavibacteriales bacterium]|nr:hypothetical protein [Ignavibacteriales bacterium]
MRFFEGGTIYVCGDGKIHKSTDFGLSWNIILSSQVRYSTVDFYDIMNGIVTGQQGVMLRTRDGGVTFEQFVIPGATYPYRLPFFFDSLNIFINTSKLYSSYDGGYSWRSNEFLVSGFQSYLEWMHMCDHFEGIAVVSNKRCCQNL